MPTVPYELTTLSGADLVAVRRSFARIVGFHSLRNLAAVAAADLPADVKEISVLGALEPGDAGPQMILRRTNGPITVHDGWIRSADRFKLDGTTDSTNGGYWEYVSNQLIYIEWFGGQSYPNTLPATPVSSLGAIQKAARFIRLAPSAYPKSTWLGSTIQLGYGCYYIDDPIVPTESIVLQGMGDAKSAGTTRLYVAAGKSAIILNPLTTLGGTPPSGAGSMSVIRNLFIGSLGYGGQTDKHGIVMDTPSVVEGCTIVGFGGHGIDITAQVEAGSNANLWYVARCSIGSNAVDGMHMQYGDANAGYSYACDFTANKRWGYNDESFLGNTGVAHHSAGNGHKASPGITRSGGAYRAVSLGSALFGCYSEGDQPPSEISAGATVVGGLQGAGFDGGGVLLGTAFHGGLSITPPTSSLGDQCGFSLRNAANTIYSYTVGNGTYDFRYISDVGFVLHYDNLAGDFAYGITPPEGGGFRAPPTYRNEPFFPKRMYLGGGYGNMRMLCFDTDESPSNGWVSFKAGDIAFDAGARYAGRMCVADGYKTALDWTTGTEYAVDDVLRTSAGRIYQCTRKPYDPDAWTKPMSTIMPTHTTGTVAYPEPNPHIDLGEGPTIPGYSWTVVSSGTYGDFPWQPAFYDVGGSIVYDEPNNRYYQCAAIPTQPAPIFNQVWAMPKSTLQPTHTSGTIEYPEPNPSPSGTEPATIPGYVWKYISTTPQLATWSKFGDFFIDGSATAIDLPSIPDTGRSAVQTMTVTGARVTDLDVSVTPNVSLQGLEVIAWVDSNDTVKFRVYNRTGAAVDLSVADWYGRVRKR